MIPDRNRFRDRLIAADLPDNITVENLTQEMATMFTRELSVPRRAAIFLNMLFAIGSAIVCGLLAATEADLPLAARLGLATGSLFGAAWFVFFLSVLRRGKLNLRVDPHRMASMVWTFTVLMMAFFLVVGFSMPDRQLGLMMMVNGLAFLIGAAVYWLNYRVESSELSTRERLLRLELMLAELKEAGR